MRSARDFIRDLSLQQGFDAVGFAPAQSSAQARADLEEYLRLGHHGDMGWMQSRAVERSNPQALWPQARSVIVLAMSYAPETDPLLSLENKSGATISVYAKGRDYHDVIKKRLKSIARALVEKFPCDVKVFVDTAPLMEKPLAQAAGLGWQGKHTNLVSRDHGSWLFLAAILTTLDLEPSSSDTDHCGTCQRCLDVCPTKAFPAPYQLDARRCISYLTIEHKGPIPRELRSLMGNRIYGCDDCLAVCPWNKFAVASQQAAFQPREELKAPRLADLAGLNDESFRALFKQSPVKRIGRDRFVRNVLIAIGNAANQDLMENVRPLLNDQASIVRGAAIWAARQLLTNEEFSQLRREHEQNEKDQDAQSEWTDN